MSDQRLVNVALKRGYITPQQLEEARRESRVLGDRGIERNLSFILMDLGFLTDEQMAEIRNSTSSANIRSLEINGHVIEGRIGSGGMGDVFRARSKHGKQVAIKIMPAKFAQDEEYLMRFHREVNVMTSLEHPHITGFRDAGEIDDRLYLIMELVEGLNLKEYIVKNGALSEDDVLVLMEQMTSALMFAQDHCGIIHRDVKPANIILGAAREGYDEPFCAKLCDFGLAKMSSRLDQDEEAHLTHSGMAVGTPHYMSPEVATGEKFIDQRTDIYSLAATAYHAITGKTMYSGRNSGIIMYQQATSQSTLRHWKEQHVSSGVKKLLEHMLEKELFSRVQTWDDVCDRVKRLQEKTFTTRMRRQHPQEIDDHPEHQGVSAPEPSLQALSAQELQGQRQEQRQHRWQIVHVLLGACILFTLMVVLSVVVWVGDDRFERHVTPDTLAIGLAAAKKHIADQFQAGVPEPFARLILEPGDYLGPLILDEQCSMLKIHAAAPGVRFIDGVNGVNSVAGEKSSAALIQCLSGARNIHIHGISCSGSTAATLITVEANAEVTLSGLRLLDNTGALMDIRGMVTIRGLHAEHFSAGIRVHPGGQVFMEDSVLAGSGLHFSMNQASARLLRCRFKQLSKDPVERLISASHGSLSMNALIIDTDSSEIAVNLDSMENVSFTNVRIHAAAIGVRSHQSQITEVSGLTIEARDVGLLWSGPWHVTWRWQGQKMHAHEPIRGESIRNLPFEGNGVDEGVMRLIPTLLPVLSPTL